MANRSRTTKRPSQESATQQAIGRSVRSWIRFTLATYTGRSVIRLPHVLTNWVIIAALAFGWWKSWNPNWLLMIILTCLCLVYSIGRAARHLPARRRTVQTLFEATRRVCKHPRGTIARPIKEDQYIKVSRWA